MISDIRRLEKGTVIETDLCIMGGGPAAIAMARELSGTKIKVCILETGGMGLERDVQSLAGGTASGIPYFDLEESRFRMLGGSTFRWGARSAPMNESDFMHRPWVPYSGWPITRDELTPYYARVEELAGWHVPFYYDEKVWEGFNKQPPSFDKQKLRFCAFQFGKIILFGEYYKKLLEQSPNTSVYLYATATNIKTNEKGNHVEYVDVKGLNGEKYVVKARTFLLAGGGIENARLLLLSNTVNPNGVCNENDLVGRFFMEHPTVSAGTIVAKNWQSLHDVFAPGMVGGRLVETGLQLAPQVQQGRECLSAVTSSRVIATADSTQALRELIWHARHRKLPGRLQWYVGNPFLMERFGKVFRDPFGIVLNIMRHLAGKPKRFKIESIYMEIRTEQQPNPDSRVTLGKKLDGLGQPCAHLHWALTEMDRRTQQVAAEIFDAELRRLQLGTLEMAPWLSSKEQTWPSDMVGGHHHMGTTRMSDNPKSGIVDKHCRTHAVDNLYIAGSSVFPTSGYVNPTSTIFALALRLADHLKARMG